MIWLCEELGIPYSLTIYERLPDHSAPPIYKALHPLGTSPTITDGSTTIAESGAVIDYIARRYGDGALTVRADQPNFAAFLFWYNFANGTFVPRIMADVQARKTNSPETPAAGGNQRSASSYAMIEDRLARVSWFAGEQFTTADIMMTFPLIRMTGYLGHDLSDSPYTQAYLAKVTKRPAYQLAISKDKS